MAEKLWFKIGEAACELGVLPAEIRYWEKKVPELRPRRSSGNLRYYHRDDLPRLRAIRQWMEAGFSAADCRELLRKLGAGVEGPGAGPCGDGGQEGGQDGGREALAPRPKPKPKPKIRRAAEPPVPPPESVPAAASEAISEESQREARIAQEPSPLPPPLPWLESVMDELKDILERLRRPLP
jgi:DNA-binding transcriptional MerR regulator